MCSHVVCQFLQLSVYLKLTFINVNDPKPSPTTQEIINNFSLKILTVFKYKGRPNEKKTFFCQK